MRHDIPKCHLKSILMYHFTREQLRNLARSNGIPRGRNKIDTVKNLLKEFEEFNIRIEISRFRSQVRFAQKRPN